jgi:hypothetical protein
MDQMQWCSLDDHLILLKNHISLGLRDAEGEESRLKMDIMPP